MRVRHLPRFKVAIAVFGVLGASAAGIAPASAQPASTPCVTSLACGPAVAQMSTLEQEFTDQYRLGYETEVDFGSPAQTPGDVVSAGGYYDSGLWTGVYMGGEAMRYATAKHYLAEPGLSARDKAFWTAQKAQAYSRVTTSAKMYDINVNIAQDWHTTLKVPPEITLTDPNVLIRLGTSGIPGQAGMLMRSCTPTTYPKAFAIAPADDDKGGDRIVGPFKWKDGKSYYCDGSPSRDTYDGTVFGLLTAFDLVSPDNLALRKDIANNLMTLTAFLYKYQWFYPRPWGNIYNPTGNDFDNFISPLMVTDPTAQLNMANAAKHVADAVGTPAEKAKFDAIWTVTFANEAPIAPASVEIDARTRDSSYYKWNLYNLIYFNLLRTNTGLERTILAKAYNVVDNTIGHDDNGWFEAINYAVTGDKDKRSNSITHLAQWIDYRKNTSGGAVINNTKTCGGSKCVLPLPVTERPPTDFLWQRSPRTDINGSQAATHRTPGIDYLAPYWMDRYESEVVNPADIPLHPLL